jgi:deazaflavin-dependent oxidoreductase (nitroreductase family)
VAPSDADDFNSKVVAEFRANEGRVGGELADSPIMLLHHVGATSGIERVTPLMYTRQQDGRLLIVASNGGSPTHPAWYRNVTVHPTVEVELGTEIFTAHAHVLEGAARTSLWSHLIAASPTLREFQSRAGRQIPVLVLTRSSDRGHFVG